MKNKILVIFLSIILLLPVSTMAIEEIGENIQPVTQEEVLQEDDAATVETPEVVTPYKTPTSKKKIAKKFIFAMLGVGISSFLIFFMLTLYNKIRDKVVNDVKTLDGETTLKTPDNLNDALKTFLDKTDWTR